MRAPFGVTGAHRRQRLPAVERLDGGRCLYCHRWYMAPSFLGEADGVYDEPRPGARGRSFTAKPMIGKAMPPFANDRRLNAYLLGDRTCAAALGREQHYLRPRHVALRRARRSAGPQALCVFSA